MEVKEVCQQTHWVLVWLIIDKPEPGCSPKILKLYSLILTLISLMIRFWGSFPAPHTVQVALAQSACDGTQTLRPKCELVSVRTSAGVAQPRPAPPAPTTVWRAQQTGEPDLNTQPSSVTAVQTKVVMWHRNITIVCGSTNVCEMQLFFFKSWMLTSVVFLFRPNLLWPLLINHLIVPYWLNWSHCSYCFQWLNWFHWWMWRWLFVSSWFK